MAIHCPESGWIGKNAPPPHFAPFGPRDCPRAISRASGCKLPQGPIFQYTPPLGSVLLQSFKRMHFCQVAHRSYHGIKTFAQVHLYYQFIWGATYFIQVLLFNQNILLNLNLHMAFSSIWKNAPPPPGFWLPDYRETHIWFYLMKIWRRSPENGDAGCLLPN